jgi:protein-S-isoprenylcysteine O-methyltransferase Ste14
VGPDDRRTARAFVIVQFALLSLIVLLPDGRGWPLPTELRRAGQLLAIMGLVILAVAVRELGPGFTALPLPNDKAALRTTGVYRLARHPIYLGLLIGTLGRALDARSWYVLAAVGLLLILLNSKARWEEVRLTARFPDYPDYARRTGRFAPRVRKGGR